MACAPAAARSVIRPTRRCAGESITTCRPPTAAKPNPDQGKRRPRSLLAGRRSCWISNTTTSSISGRASATSSLPRAGLHAARRHACLRRQPYRHARRVRRAGLRHRHLRGRARAGDADPEPGVRVEKNMRINVDGTLPANVTAKDIILAVIGEILAPRRRRTGYSIEYAGEAIRELSMEGRMTVYALCRSGAGAKAGMIAPDETSTNSSKAVRRRRRASCGTTRGVIGNHCRPTTARSSTARSASTPRSYRRSCPGAAARRQVTSITGRVPSASRDRRRAQAARRRALAGLHGVERRREDHRHPSQPRVHRLMHQLAHRGSALGGTRRRRQEGQRKRLRDDRPRLRSGEGASRGRKVSTRSSGCRLRLARTRLLDVPRHEPGQTPAW